MNTPLLPNARRFASTAIVAAWVLMTQKLEAQFMLSVRITSNAPNLSLSGPAGDYAILYTPVLGGAASNWLSLTNVSIVNNSTNVVDQSASGQAQRYYRAMSTGLEPTNPNPALLVWIAPGTFTMGSPTNEAGRNAAYEEQHLVTLTKGFYLSKYLVTQTNYFAVTGTNPSTYNSSPNLPVETVSWTDASNYCVLLSNSEQAAGRLPSGWVYRLPTEAEWECACRAGTTIAFYFGSAIHGGMANFNSANEYDAAAGTIVVTNPVGYVGQSTVVGSYAANPLGLFDMCGNVMEWCQDWYLTYPSGPQNDPVGGGAGAVWRVIRGGSFARNGVDCRAAARSGSVPSNKTSRIGFRVVLGRP